MVLCGELKSDEWRYLPIRYGHWVQDDDPDGNGDYQVRCSLCGAYDIRNIYGVKPVPFCYQCAACMVDEEPRDALTAKEIFRREFGDHIDRDEEESD